MANTTIDNVINDLNVWDFITFDWEECEITYTDSMICTLRDSNLDTYNYTWSDISEDLEMQLQENKIDTQVDIAVKS